MTRDLTALFDPKSVAVLGASNDETKYGNWLSVQAVRMTDTARSTSSTAAANPSSAGPRCAASPNSTSRSTWSP